MLLEYVPEGHPEVSISTQGVPGAWKWGDCMTLQKSLRWLNQSNAVYWFIGREKPIFNLVEPSTNESKNPSYILIAIPKQ